MNDGKFLIFLDQSKLSINAGRDEHLLIYFKDLTIEVTKTKSDSMNKLLIVDGIMGIFSALNYSFLIVITKSQLTSVIRKKDKIYKVLETEFVPLFENKKVPEDLKVIIESMQIIFKKGFYFSNTYDLSNNYSAQNQLRKSSNNFYDYIIEGNPNCLANFNFIDKFVENNIGSKFLSSCIYGYVDTVDYDFQDKKTLKVTVISRRYVPGFRIWQFQRGLNKEGVLANQVETELIVEYNNQYFYSFIILGGSVPCYYSDISSKKGNKVIKAYNEYIKSLIDEYSLICFVNVQNEQKENDVNEKFKKLLLNQEKDIKNIKFYKLEIENNAESKENKEDVIRKFVDKRKNMLNFLLYLCESKFVNYEQRGIISVNGPQFKQIIEVQMRITWWIMHNMLLFCGQSLNDFFSPKFERYNTIEEDNYTYNDNKEEFYMKYFLIWKKNEQALQKQYRKNLNENIARNYQRILEIMFGTFSKQKPLEHDMKFFQSKYTQKSNLNIYIGTWNTGACDVKKQNLILDSWLIPKGQNAKTIPDIYFIGLQEAVELSTMNVIAKSKQKETMVDIWEKKILETISQKGRIIYERLKVLNLVGIVLFAFVRKEKSKNLGEIKVKIIKTGLGGATGNKGSCMITFNYFNTSIAVACSHLAAGLAKNSNRISELTEILESKFLLQNPDEVENTNTTTNQIGENNLKRESFGIPSLSNTNIPPFQQKDVWFIFGDLNFRIDTDYENSINYIKKNDWKNLVEFDQLFKSKTALLSLRDSIEEHKINHQPTYKFSIGTNEYDEKKKRLPSWCDRILFKNYQNEQEVYIKTLEYNAAFDDCFNVSDHRPVYGLFEIMVLEDIKNIKEQYENEIKNNIELEISSSYMKKKFLV